MVNPYASPTGDEEPIILAEVVTEHSKHSDVEFMVWCYIIAAGLAITLPPAIENILVLFW